MWLIVDLTKCADRGVGEFEEVDIEYWKSKLL